MSETPTGGMGERRRRRTAERARLEAQAAERPMTRRERRAMEEALASGATRITNFGYGPMGEVPTTTSGQRALTPEQVQASAGWGQRPSHAGHLDQIQVDQTQRAEPAQAPEPEPEPEPGVVSRRSLRQQRAAADVAEQGPEQPSERTTTGRRPVVRPPAAARGVRTVDETGELTDVQRAVRDINAAPDTPDEPGTPKDLTWPGSGSSYHVLLTDASADHVPADEAQVKEEQAATHTVPVDEPGPKQAVADPTDAAPEAAEPEPNYSFDMRPQWPSLATVQTGENTVMEPQEGDYLEADDDDDRDTPRWLVVLYVLVVILAIGVLGILVWRMATGDLFSTNGAAVLLSSIGSFLA